MVVYLKNTTIILFHSGPFLLSMSNPLFFPEYRLSFYVFHFQYVKERFTKIMFIFIYIQYAHSQVRLLFK